MSDQIENIAQEGSAQERHVLSPGKMPTRAASAAMSLAKQVVGRLTGPHAAVSARPFRPGLLWRQISRRLGLLPEPNVQRMGVNLPVQRSVSPFAGTARPPRFVLRARPPEAQHEQAAISDTGMPTWPKLPPIRPTFGTPVPVPAQPEAEPADSEPALSDWLEELQAEGEDRHALPAEHGGDTEIAPTTPQPASKAEADVEAERSDSAGTSGPPSFVPAKLVRIAYEPEPPAAMPRPLITPPVQVAPQIPLTEPIARAAEPIGHTNIAFELNRELAPAQDLLARMPAASEVEYPTPQPQPATPVPTEPASNRQVNPRSMSESYIPPSPSAADFPLAPDRSLEQSTEERRGPVGKLLDRLRDVLTGGSKPTEQATRQSDPGAQPVQRTGHSASTGAQASSSQSSPAPVQTSRDSAAVLDRPREIVSAGSPETSAPPPLEMTLAQRKPGTQISQEEQSSTGAEPAFEGRKGPLDRLVRRVTEALPGGTETRQTPPTVEQATVSEPAQEFSTGPEPSIQVPVGPEASPSTAQQRLEPQAAEPHAAVPGEATTDESIIPAEAQPALSPIETEAGASPEQIQQEAQNDSITVQAEARPAARMPVHRTSQATAEPGPASQESASTREMQPEEPGPRESTSLLDAIFSRFRTTGENQQAAPGGEASTAPRRMAFARRGRPATPEPTSAHQASNEAEPAWPEAATPQQAQQSASPIEESSGQPVSDGIRIAPPEVVRTGEQAAAAGEAPTSILHSVETTGAAEPLPNIPAQAEQPTPAQTVEVAELSSSPAAVIGQDDYANAPAVPVAAPESEETQQPWNLHSDMADQIVNAHASASPPPLLPEASRSPLLSRIAAALQQPLAQAGSRPGTAETERGLGEVGGLETGIAPSDAQATPAVPVRAPAALPTHRPNMTAPASSGFDSSTTAQAGPSPVLGGRASATLSQQARAAQPAVQRKIAGAEGPPTVTRPPADMSPSLGRQLRTAEIIEPAGAASQPMEPTMAGDGWQTFGPAATAPEGLAEHEQSSTRLEDALEEYFGMPTAEPQAVAPFGMPFAGRPPAAVRPPSPSSFFPSQAPTAESFSWATGEESESDLAEANAWAEAITSAAQASELPGMTALALADESSAPSEQAELTQKAQSSDEQGGPELDELAESVYAIIRRRLEIERERHLV